MIDIKFYQQMFKIKKMLQEGKVTCFEAFDYFQGYCSNNPVVFNIETTNNCYMQCQMCPRPTRMTRPVGTMSMSLFKRIIKQLKPWSQTEWSQWTNFVSKNYGVHENDMNENHFFLYVVPQVITLHGFGDPLLDEHITDRVILLTKKHLKSYFSSHPYNADYDKIHSLFVVGLDYLKFSAESIVFFKKTEQQLKQIIETSNDYNTKIILDIVGKQNDYNELSKMFKDFDVYMYYKSQDNKWFNNSNGQNAIHWLEPCQFPWSSISIMWDGSVVPCGQDYNNEMVLGDANKQSLESIWNSVAYYQFRKNHLLRKNRNKCTRECDMKLVGEF